MQQLFLNIVEMENLLFSKKMDTSREKRKNLVNFSHFICLA